MTMPIIAAFLIVCVSVQCENGKNTFQHNIKSLPFQRFSRSLTRHHLSHPFIHTLTRTFSFHKNNTNNSSSSSFSFLFYLACFGPGQPFSSVIRMFYENECVCKCTKRRRPRKEEALERKSMQNETINGHIKRQHSERARRHLLCTDPESGCKSAQRQQHQ